MGLLMLMLYCEQWEGKCAMALYSVMSLACVDMCAQHANCTRTLCPVHAYRLQRAREVLSGLVPYLPGMPYQPSAGLNQ